MHSSARFLAQKLKQSLRGLAHAMKIAAGMVARMALEYLLRDLCGLLCRAVYEILNNWNI